MPELLGNTMFKFTYVSNENESYFTYSLKDPSVTGRSVLDISGQMQVLIWLEARGEWSLLYARPGDQCDIYAYCGAFGTCNRNHIPLCMCFRGFQPKSVGDWNAGDMSGGCVRKVPLQCGNDSEVNGQIDQFLRISKVRLPDNSIVLSRVRSVGDCQSACFSNCSCSAYTYDYSDGCSIWRENLSNADQLTDDTTDGRDFYLRLAASEFLGERKDSRIKWRKWIILALAVPMMLLVTVGFLYCLWRRKSRNRGEDLVLFDLGTSIGAANCKLNDAGKSDAGKTKEVDFPLFSFASVCAATDNFSDTNKLGKGGFGSVYKGKLLKGDSLNLLGYAWELWKSGRGEDIKDPLLQDISSTNMLLRYLNIALLCVEESAADRPAMSNVEIFIVLFSSGMNVAGKIVELECNGVEKAISDGASHLSLVEHLFLETSDHESREGRKRREMGFFSNRVESSEIVAGDHIYTWRCRALVTYHYAHHGIYIGEGLVIHFTAPPGKLSTALSSGLSSSSLAPVGPEKTCPKHPRCGSRKPGSGVAVSCLYCFLGKGFLYCCEYGASKFYIWCKLPGTCTTAQSDPGNTVLQRANYLLENGFGQYHLVKNNCEDFALYCKTGIWVTGDKLGRSAQIANRKHKSPGSYDIGLRKDVIKVPVEDMDKFHRGLKLAT
ncbi:hypothetical protein Vadar_002389 [Vaccinium darrowii]|uniref:Uncharacterized protein n=1 Tax=Vaccinium darrowii TaxID=229202 RepID=A0ACB7XMN0_9ERIC|nr:hypothetical protein Vadar_002389 [Vaccinium darrowii]